MKRSDLEHLIRASAAITGTDEFVIVGSQSILGQFPHAPAALTISVEADLFSMRSVEDAELIDGSIGEGSPFHTTFGYYAHGIARETVVLPTGWRDRLVTVRNENTRHAAGLCLEVHDLALSKLVAGREKDISFVEALIDHRLADIATIRERLAVTEMDEARREACETRISRLAAR